MLNNYRVRFRRHALSIWASNQIVRVKNYSLSGLIFSQFVRVQKDDVVQKLWNGTASLGEILGTKFFFSHTHAYQRFAILPCVQLLHQECILLLISWVLLNCSPMSFPNIKHTRKIFPKNDFTFYLQQGTREQHLTNFLQFYNTLCFKSLLHYTILNLGHTLFPQCMRVQL